jgi:hypothetical protein
MTLDAGGAMARFAVTAVFEVGPGKVPRGADVLDRVSIPEKATHRFSYCDGTTLTVVIDWTAPSEEAARENAVTAIRLIWSQLTGNDPGAPLTVRVRSLTPKVVARVAAGARRLTSWHPEGLPAAFGRVETSSWRAGGDDDPDDPDDPDDGGLAGVREPRRPKPGPGSLYAALEEPGPRV